jgi:hypothetical protein
MRLLSSRWLVLLLSTVFLLATLAACGGSDEDAATPAASNTQPAAATLAPPTAIPVPPTATAVPATATPAPTDTPTPQDEAGDASALPDVPLPEDAEAVSYEFGELAFTSPSDVATLVDFFRDALAGEGWQELSDASLVEEEFAYAEFEQDGETLALTLFGSSGGSEAYIDLSDAPSLTGATDDTAGAPAAPAGLTIADWPAPPDATELEVSGDTLSFKTVLSLADVAEFYRPIYASNDLDASCLEDVADYSSVSCSYSNGDITVSFFAFEGFGETEVEIEVTNYALQAGEDDSGELGVEEEDGLPLPDDHTGYSSESGEFRRMIALTSPSDLATLSEFYQTELASRGWTLDEVEGTDSDATLRFSGEEGELVVTLLAGDETEVTLVQRDQAAAEAAGVLPPAGLARLYLVNFTESDMTVTIDGETIDVPPSAGMESPDDAPQVELPPGTYDVTTEVGGSSVTDEIAVGPDETWALLLDEEGALPLQMY